MWFDSNVTLIQSDKSFCLFKLEQLLIHWIRYQRELHVCIPNLPCHIDFSSFQRPYLDLLWTRHCFHIIYIWKMKIFSLNTKRDYLVYTTLLLRLIRCPVIKVSFFPILLSFQAQNGYTHDWLYPKYIYLISFYCWSEYIIRSFNWIFYPSITILIKFFEFVLIHPTNSGIKYRFLDSGVVTICWYTISCPCN